jgi:hypothetical protein
MHLPIVQQERGRRDEENEEQIRASINGRALVNRQ